MALRYSEIFNQNADFQRAVNLSLDQGSLSLVEKYIPTTSSAAVLARYLKAVVKPSNDRASILIGPYGKGKSHTLFVVLAIVSEEGEQAEAIFTKLAERVGNVNSEAAELIRQIRQSKIRMLPVVVNDRYLDVRQAFLASVRAALSNAGLSDIMPDNYYQRCLDTIARWKMDFPATYTAYEQYLIECGMNVTDFESDLRQFNADALSVFRACHKAILSGTEFDPLLESDVPTLYKDISETLQQRTDYSGLFIVFDEFGKYLESTVSGGERFKALQDLAELCSRSSEPRMLISCISHKAISEYASHLSQVQRSSFRTIEGRFEPVYFTSTFEGSFSLIAGALGRTRELYDQFIAAHSEEHKKTILECVELGCFAGYESSVEQIVDQCFPMHPLTTLSLMRLSEQAAQNERTLFTFLSEPTSLLADFIRSNQGEYALAPASMVYDYFHVTIRENSYDDDLKGTIIHADSLIPSLSQEEAELVKTIVLFSMVADNCLLATKQTIIAALQWTEDKFLQIASHLEQNHVIYTRRSDGVVCLMQSTTESVRQDIETELLRRNSLDIGDQLNELHDPGYTIPRRYNDKYEMVRFFQNVFVSAERFLKYPNAEFLSEQGFADGYVIYLLGDLAPEEVQRVLRQWNDPHVIVLLPTTEFTGQHVIRECAAIKRLLEHPSDEVAAEELSYYYEDLLQMVNQTYTSLFQKSPLLVTMDGVAHSKNISSEVSTLCETILYPDCPVICHEMINRSEISGQMKQSRGKVIDAVLNNGDFLTVFQAKTAEGAVIRAVLGHVQDEKMRAVTDIITEYIGLCEDEKKPIAPLYRKLTSSPYGMRKGVLPILLAYCLKDKHQNAVLYNHGQEFALNGDTLNALDEHYVEYELLVDRGSADQTTYIQCLHDKYTPDDIVPNSRSIYEALCKLVRSLPRSARANRKVLANEQVLSLNETTIDVRSVLIRFDNNARDALINQIPRKTAFGYACKESANEIITVMQDLSDYTKRLITGMKQVVRSRMGASYGQSIRGTMTIWLQKQPANHLNHSFSGPTSSLLNIMRSHDNRSDSDIINMVAVALTGLPVEDWSDKQVEEFTGLFDAALSEVENVHDNDEELNYGSRVHLSVNGMTLDQALPDQDIEGLASVAYDSVKSALNEFGDSLSTEEKLLILANLMLRVNE